MFAFGGFLKTTKWVSAVQAGRFTVNDKDGDFDVKLYRAGPRACQAAAVILRVDAAAVFFAVHCGQRPRGPFPCGCGCRSPR